jgi:hypothetical protein
VIRTHVAPKPVQPDPTTAIFIASRREGRIGTGAWGAGVPASFVCDLKLMYPGSVLVRVNRCSMFQSEQFAGGPAESASRCVFEGKMPTLTEARGKRDHLSALDEVLCLGVPRGRAEAV